MKTNQIKSKQMPWIPAVLVMIVIFLFSAKDASASDATSHPIAKVVLCVVEKLGSDISLGDYEYWIDRLNFIVRKAAHITEYTILSICLYRGWYSVQLTNKGIAVLTFVSGVFYAATDEFHQRFVPGRGGQISDVGIDSLGCILGIIVCIIFLKIKNKDGRNEYGFV